ncbi:blue light-inducible protein-like protein Bli-3 [Lophium mytilinum]|uniref:Blue light-inducible protein-like protein Bli-3 n=1 Tax=Lophium mytilinum TaxID=390894 RepID=A0A6A6R9V0_9PEZI|nr:blue light-inducible protein-like protein Bli-3 [Lophium mytilinum]
MPDTLTKEEVNSQTDPSLSKQYDNETPKDQQIKELYDLVDSKKIGLLSTFRNGVGPVARSMAVAKRVGPDFLFLANLHSNKFKDIKENPVVQVTFQDSSTQDWVSVAGKVVTSANDDPRIKELWSHGVKAWFGDLGDGKHDGSADDPRMALIEVKTNYISYWLHQVGTLGFIKEVGLAAATGKVANTGVSRELKEADVEKARREA